MSQQVLFYVDKTARISTWYLILLETLNINWQGTFLLGDNIYFVTQITTWLQSPLKPHIPAVIHHYMLLVHRVEES